MRYNPALDGLRAVAIIFVVCHHVVMGTFPGFWIGVDVFFVLSGYLITSMLLAELRETGAISLRRFYIRRALRLTPALGVVFAFQLIRMLIERYHRAEIGEATLIAAAYMENWNMVYGFGPTDFLGHTWSLATEEQFYMLWPLALPFVFRSQPLAWIVFGVIAMSATRLWDHDGAFTTLQFSPFLRPVGLLIGCALAFMPISHWRAPNGTAPALICALVATGFKAPGMVAVDPLLASLCTACLIICMQRPSLTARLFATKPIRYIGRISYGLYLYMLPIILITAQWKPHETYHLYGAFVIALIFGAAALSYEFVEKPFLRLKDRLGACRAAEPTLPATVAAE
jgi:peptidoglycan/LPS O-acetylase OafA/YrhL